MDRFIAPTRAHAHPCTYTTTCRPVFGQQLLALFGALPSQRPAGVQPPMYQPTQRPSRSRSASPDLERSTTAPPFTALVIFSPETIHDRPLRWPHPRAQFRPPRGHSPPAQPPLSLTSQPMHTMGDAPAKCVPHVQPVYPVVVNILFSNCS